MAIKRKFYKTTIKVEVLSELPLPSNPNLAGIAYAIIDGDCSGTVTTESVEELDGPAAAKALMEQGSDPSFFMLTENGENEL